MWTPTPGNTIALVAICTAMLFNGFVIGAGFHSLMLVNTWAMIRGRVRPGVHVRHRRHGRHGRRRHLLNYGSR
ncbi:hypothetical protein KN63_04690 [Smithella sp. F21]|nr:hypothetical protein KN63_04690 [Smithella sp. F21]